MRDSADVAWMPGVRSRRTFFRSDIVCQDQPLDLEFESTPNFSCSDMHAARGPFFGLKFGHIFPLAFLSSSALAVFRGPTSDGGNEVHFAAQTEHEGAETTQP